MDLHLDSRAEELIERQLRNGRFRSAEEVVVSALEALSADPKHASEAERALAVERMLQFSKTHATKLEPGERIRDWIHEGHKY